jgi:hypothetical protein
LACQEARQDKAIANLAETICGTAVEFSGVGHVVRKNAVGPEGAVLHGDVQDVETGFGDGALGRQKMLHQLQAITQTQWIQKMEYF